MWKQTLSSVFTCWIVLSCCRANAGNPVIVPGRSIGLIRLGLHKDGMDTLGPESGSDTAMGRSWITWISKKNYLDVYVERNEEGRVPTKLIHVTSPYFHTLDGISTRSSFAQVKAKYHLSFVKSFDSDRAGGPIFLYDDVKRGIAFEIWKGEKGKRVSGDCVGIIVHLKGRHVNEEYMAPSGYLGSIPDNSDN